MIPTLPLVAITIAAPLALFAGIRGAWLNYRATFPPTRDSAASGTPAVPEPTDELHQQAAVRHFLDGHDSALYAQSLVSLARNLPGDERLPVLETASRMLADAEASMHLAAALLEERAA